MRRCRADQVAAASVSCGAARMLKTDSLHSALDAEARLGPGDGDVLAAGGTCASS